VLQSEEFRALWDRIKSRTTYRVEFDHDALIAGCTQALRDAPPIAPTRLQWTKANLTIGKAGVEAEERPGEGMPVALREDDIELPDFLTELQDRTSSPAARSCGFSWTAAGWATSSATLRSS